MAKLDWPAIEVEYLAGIKSTNAISKEYGCSEGAIRKKAKAEGWVKNPTKAKREQVKARLAESTKKGTKKGTNYNVRTKIAEAVDEDVHDMNLALSNARKALVKVGTMLDSENMDCRDLKTLSETNKLNMEVIRRVRGLDEERSGDGDLSDLMKTIAEDATAKGVIR